MNPFLSRFRPAARLAATLGLVASLLAGSGVSAAMADEGRFVLTIAHLNDTHSHLEGTPVKLTGSGKSRTVTLGGFPRIATLVRQLRSGGNLLFLHAGDAFQGTLYFTRFSGEADWTFLNYLGIDGMTFGNHEFDRGPALAGALAEHTRFPLIAANLDVSREPALEGKVVPWVVYGIGGQRVGVIGLAMAETPSVSNPGALLRFHDPVEAARAQVAILQRMGIDKIVVLSHNGFDNDRLLARSVAGIDVIVGGHSHTLLGGEALRQRGLDPEGPYPTVVTGPDGGKALIVTAWEWGKVLGALTVEFDGKGRVVAHRGEPIPVDETVAEEPGARELLRRFSLEVEALTRQNVAVALDDLPRITPDGEPVLGRVVAEALLWKGRLLDPAVSVALQNAGGIRADIDKGEITVGTVKSVLPFADSLVILDLDGEQLLAALNEAAAAAADGKIKGPTIAAGLRYRIDPARPAGSRVVDAEVMEGAKGWRMLNPARTYRVITGSYSAEGGDFQTALRTAGGYRKDTGVVDSDAFTEYARFRKSLTRPGRTPERSSGLLPGRTPAVPLPWLAPAEVAGALSAAPSS